VVALEIRKMIVDKNIFANL